MNYLSFDVGIKNLSYCILTPDKKIKYWGIINLNNNPICEVNLRKKCENQSTFIVKDNCEINYCCSNHKKKFKKTKKIESNNILDISKKCIESLRELNTSEIKYVLIENQPALKNPIMKTIQVIIYTFFVIEGVMNDESTINEIFMVNARNKLKVYKGPKIMTPYTNEKKNKYKNNKYLSIAYTKKMIENEKEEFKNIFNESKKKDDLADSYLQGIYWIDKT